MKPGFLQFKNHLQKDGECFLIENFLKKEEADSYYNQLFKDVNWREDEITLFGRKVMQPRLVAWYADPGKRLRYSGLTLEPNKWLSSLTKIKQNLQEFCNHEFNGVLVNLYRNQKDSNGWHSDDEKELGKEPLIASLSLGETRDFLLKHKKDEDLKIKIPLKAGSLLIMGGKSQQCWKHCLPKRTPELGPRINLTFRKIF